MNDKYILISGRCSRRGRRRLATMATEFATGRGVINDVIDDVIDDSSNPFLVSTNPFASAIATVVRQERQQGLGGIANSFAIGQDGRQERDEGGHEDVIVVEAERRRRHEVERPIIRFNPFIKDDRRGSRFAEGQGQGQGFEASRPEVIKAERSQACQTISFDQEVS